MADSYRDIAQTLLDRAGLRFQAKGTPYDVVYTEQETVDRSSAAARFPSLAKPHLPAQCVPGARHPKSDYLVLVDAYRNGGDDHHDNWTKLYRVDLQQLEADGENAGFTFPDFLANDGVTTQFPYYDDSEDITWQFDVVLPNGDTLVDPEGNAIVDEDGNNLVAPNLGYTKPEQGTPHPLVPDALYLNEQWQRNGPVLTVVRHYKKVAPLSVQAKMGYKITGEYPGYALVDLIYECAKSDYNPPSPGSACPINDGGSLNFSSYKIIQPPQVEVLDPLTLRVTLRYGALPGPIIALPQMSPGVTGQGTDYQQRRSPGDTFASLALTLKTEENNGYAKVWTWHVPDSITLTTQRYDSETGLLDVMQQQIVAAGTSGASINSSGVYSTVEPLNSSYSIKETTTLALFAQRPTFVDYEVDPETRNFITVVRQIVYANDGPSMGLGQEVTQKQLNAVFALRVTRSIGFPSGYDLPDHVDFSMPAILDDLEGIPTDDGKWKVHAVTTASYRKQLRARRYVTFHSSPPASSNLWTIKPTTFHYDGVHFSVALDNLIMDAKPNYGASGGAFVEVVDIPASSPSRAEYLAARGHEQLWAEQCAVWRYGYYRREQLYIIPE